MFYTPSPGQPSLTGYPATSTAATANMSSPPSYETIVLDPNGPRSQTNLFVRRLASAVSEADMAKIFSPYGNLLSFALMRNIYSGESLGTAFVRFETHEQAKAAMAALDGAELYGRNISIQWAKKQHDGTPVGEARKKIHKLFVRNVPLDVTGRQLRNVFAKYGNISNVTLIGDTAVDRDGAHPERNIAFILFQEDGAAEAAVRGQHNTCPFPSCEGIPLMVKLAEDNRQRLERRQCLVDANGHVTSFTSPGTTPTSTVLQPGMMVAGVVGSGGGPAGDNTPCAKTITPLVSPFTASLSPSTTGSNPHVQQATSSTSQPQPASQPTPCLAGPPLMPGFVYTTSPQNPCLVAPGTMSAAGPAMQMTAQFGPGAGAATFVDPATGLPTALAAPAAFGPQYYPTALSPFYMPIGTSGQPFMQGPSFPFVIQQQPGTGVQSVQMPYTAVPTGPMTASGPSTPPQQQQQPTMISSQPMPLPPPQAPPMQPMQYIAPLTNLQPPPQQQPPMTMLFSPTVGMQQGMPMSVGNAAAAPAFHAAPPTIATSNAGTQDGQSRESGANVSPDTATASSEPAGNAVMAHQGQTGGDVGQPAVATGSDRQRHPQPMSELAVPYSGTEVGCAASHVVTENRTNGNNEIAPRTYLPPYTGTAVIAAAAEAQDDTASVEVQGSVANPTPHELGRCAEP